MIACLFSCEHATCAVPEAFRELFRGSEEIVASPKGWDPGALNLAQGFSMKFRTPLVHGEVTRLLIDVNENGDDRWSKFSKTLPEATRAKLVDRHERPFRAALDLRIGEDMQRNDAMLHLMVHTEDGDLTGVLIETAQKDGIAENFASKWQGKLMADGVTARVARGEIAGGLAKDLVARYDPAKYALLKIRVPQSYFLEGKPLRWDTLRKALFSSLGHVISTFEIPVAAVKK